MLLDYPIPANDDGIKAIKIICETVINAYKKGKEAGGNQTEEPKVETKEPSKKSAEAVLPQVDEVLAAEAAVLEQEIEAKVLEDSQGKEGKIE